jgi:hypothetical protein
MAQFLSGKKFQSVADVEVGDEEFFASKDKEWFYQVFKELAENGRIPLNMRPCILSTELHLFCMFWPIKFSFRIRYYLWDTLSILRTDQLLVCQERLRSSEITHSCLSLMLLIIQIFDNIHVCRTQMLWNCNILVSFRRYQIWIR